MKKGTTLKIMPQVPEKPDKALGVKEGKESCSEGNYYCFDEKKCKPIPKGTKVGKDGMLVKEASLAQAKEISVETLRRRHVGRVTELKELR